MRRTLYNILLAPMWLYLLLVRRKRQGAKCVVVYKNKVLMLRNSYGTGRWTFPGGGMKKGETAERAAKRETKEEVGLGLHKISVLGGFTHKSLIRNDSIYAFIGEATSDKVTLSWEIAEAHWFKWDKLPKPLSPVATTILEMLQTDE